MEVTRIISVALGIIFAICAIEAALNCYTLLSDNGLQASGLARQAFRLLLYTFVAYDFIIYNPIGRLVNWVKK